MIMIVILLSILFWILTYAFIARLASCPLCCIKKFEDEEIVEEPIFVVDDEEDVGG
jgi:hypothetical protein